MPEEITIPGTKKKIPTKVLVFAVGGGVLLFILTRRRGAATTSAAPASEDGLMASEYNQRLQEQRDAWSGLMGNREGSPDSTQLINTNDTASVDRVPQPSLEYTNQVPDVAYIPQSYTPQAVSGVTTFGSVDQPNDTQISGVSMQPYTKPKILFALQKTFAEAADEGNAPPTLNLHVTGPGGTTQSLAPIPPVPLQVAQKVASAVSLVPPPAAPVPNKIVMNVPHYVAPPPVVPVAPSKPKPKPSTTTQTGKANTYAT